MSSDSLPPLRNLPHWSRVGCLDKPVPVPPPAAKTLQPLADISPADRAKVSTPRDMVDTRVSSLQRNVQFLQQQHKDILQKLHGEIDSLKRENKELQYQLIMEPPTTCRKGSSQQGTRPPAQCSEAQTQRRVYLEQALEDTRPPQDQGPLSSTRVCSETPGATPRPLQEYEAELRGGLITSLKPLRIHSSASHPPRAPTLQECEVIIRQLYNANSMQSQEIIRVKAVLRDIVFNKKITPENHILTKAYLADGTRTEAERFPRLAPQPLPKKMSGLQAGVVADRVVLPALKQSLSSTIADRQKRSQAVQRSRLRRPVH